MSFAIIRGSNGRRHEVDFKDDPVAVNVSMSESCREDSVAWNWISYLPAPNTDSSSRLTRCACESVCSRTSPMCLSSVMLIYAKPAWVSILKCFLLVLGCHGFANAHKLLGNHLGKLFKCYVAEVIILFHMIIV